MTTRAFKEYTPGWAREQYLSAGVFLCPRCQIITTMNHTVQIKAGKGFLRYLCVYCWNDSDVGQRLRWAKQVLGEAEQMEHWAECAAAIWSSP